MVKIALNIPDCHIPWHDKAAYTVMLTIAKDLNEKVKPLDQINIMGDFADFHGVKLHPKMPYEMSLKETLRDEIRQVYLAVKQLRDMFPEAEINYIEGNHEQRLQRYLVQKAPELFDFVTLPELLKFDTLGIRYYPYGRGQLVQCLDTDYHLRHAPYNAGKHTAASTAHNKGISLGFGHTHRKQSYTFKTAMNQEISCYSMGWLGDETAPIFNYIDTDNWSKGFQIVYSVDGLPIIHTVDIRDHKAVYNGILYV